MIQHKYSIVLCVVTKVFSRFVLVFLDDPVNVTCRDVFHHWTEHTLLISISPQPFHNSLYYIYILIENAVHWHGEIRLGIGIQGIHCHLKKKILSPSFLGEKMLCWCVCMWVLTLLSKNWVLCKNVPVFKLRRTQDTWLH